MNNQKISSNTKNLIKKIKLPWWKECVLNFNEQEVVRVKSVLFYLIGLLSAVVGIVMILFQIPGGPFLFLNCTILFLYPAVRFLFGGKDSVLAMVWTIVFDFYLKSKIEDSIKKSRKK